MVPPLQAIGRSLQSAQTTKQFIQF
jgi:hypothetical protein